MNLRDAGCDDCRRCTCGDCGKYGPRMFTTYIREAFRCPVCEGRGYVPNGFYDSFAGQPWSANAIGRDTCESCGGKGYVVI
jgi:hypothetical protein